MWPDHWPVRRETAILRKQGPRVAELWNVPSSKNNYSLDDWVLVVGFLGAWGGVISKLVEVFNNLLTSLPALVINCCIKNTKKVLVWNNIYLLSHSIFSQTSRHDLIESSAQSLTKQIYSLTKVLVRLGSVLELMYLLGKLNSFWV